MEKIRGLDSGKPWFARSRKLGSSWEVHRQRYPTARSRDRSHHLSMNLDISSSEPKASIGISSGAISLAFIPVEPRNSDFPEACMMPIDASLQQQG